MLEEAAERARANGADLVIMFCLRSPLIDLSGLVGQDPRLIMSEAQGEAIELVSRMLELVAPDCHARLLGVVPSVNKATRLAASHECLALVQPAKLPPPGRRARRRAAKALVRLITVP